MSKNYTPSGTYPSFPLVLPQDGELLNESTLTLGILEPLIDAVGVNAARTWTATQTFTNITCNNNYRVSSRTATRIRPIHWQIDSGFAFTGERWVDAGVGGRMSAVIEVPNAQELTGISLWLDAAPHGALPVTRPQFTLERVTVGTSASPTTIATKIDSADLATYQTYHEVAMTGLTTTVAASTLAYRIILDGESGANQQTDLQAYGWVKLVYTRAIIGED